MNDKDFVQEFIEYWSKNNNDKFYDEIDIRNMLKKFYFEKFEFTPDFRNKSYSNIWKAVKNILIK